MEKPLILLSNDDGFRAPGLLAVREALRPLGRIIVCAPETEQSAASHALTLRRPLRLLRHEEDVFSVDGTPADSVYVSLYAGERVLPSRPKLVVSGLNRGVNLGDDVFYSGTVAAAREAALKGIPALAVSADLGADVQAAAAMTRRLAAALLEAPPEPSVLLNVNFPPGDSWPLRATRLGARVYTETVEFRRDPRGQEYLWIGGPGIEHRTIAGSDTEAFDEGVVGVTPLVMDLWGREQQAEAESVVTRAGDFQDGQTVQS